MKYGQLKESSGHACDYVKVGTVKHGVSLRILLKRQYLISSNVRLFLMN